MSLPDKVIIDGLDWKIEKGFWYESIPRKDESGRIVYDLLLTKWYQQKLYILTFFVLCGLSGIILLAYIASPGHKINWGFERKAVPSNVDVPDRESMF